MGTSGARPHIEVFLGSVGSPSSALKRAPSSRLGYYSGGFAYQKPARLTTDNHHRSRLPSCVTPMLSYYRSTLKSVICCLYNRSYKDSLTYFKATCLGLCGLEPVGEYQLLHPFGYACRPHLRSRLTQGRRAWPWNPQSSGGEDSHFPCRYSCLHSHLNSVHKKFPYLLHPLFNALLPSNVNITDASSEVCLSPATFSAQGR